MDNKKTTTTIGTYIEEYFNIVMNVTEINTIEKLIEKGKIQKLKEKNLIAIDREYIEKLLLQNNYQDVTAKLRIWRSFGLIQADENRFTKNIRFKKNKFKRMVVVNLQPFNTIKTYKIQFNKK